MSGDILTVLSAVVAAFITGATGIIVALIQLFGKLKEIAADATDTKNQVINSHPTNLRDDLDEIRNEVATIKTEVAALRTSLANRKTKP